MREWRQKNPQKVLDYRKDYGNTHRKEIREGDARHRERAKIIVNEYYSNGTNACADPHHLHLPNDPIARDIRALEIDHIGDDGQDERKKLGKVGSGWLFYDWLIKHNFPKGYQVLCASCNRIKQIEHLKRERLNRLKQIPLP